MHTREPLKAALIKKTAEIEGITAASVRRVLNNTRNNEKVFQTFLFLEKETEKAISGVSLVRKIQKKIASDESLKTLFQ